MHSKTQSQSSIETLPGYPAQPHLRATAMKTATPSHDTLLETLETATRIHEQTRTGATLARALVASVHAHAAVRIALALETIADELQRATLRDIEDAIARGELT